MVSIVVVSHSAQIAAGVRELANQMVKKQVPISAAGGTDNPENPIGTDPLQVLAAIQEVYSEDGVVVLMDLGSALLSAETALDFLPPEQRDNVFLCAAPLVEGALAAAVQASVGGSAQQVIAEATQALAAKQVQFGGMGQQVEETAAAVTAGTDAGPQITLTINNRRLLHARPAAQFVTAANSFNADLTVQKRDRQANAKSINQVATLGARRGDTITVWASGP